MAEAPEPSGKTIEKLEEEITCPVCQDQFDDPKVLPCLHYYCRKCVLDLALRAQPFSCPECRTPTLLHQNNPNHLPTAFFVNRLKELYKHMEKAEGKVESPCEMCSQSKAIAFCRQCTYFICSECVQCHNTMKVFVGHNVGTLEELKQGGAKVISIKQPPTPTCKVHDNEPLKMYCYDCDSLICKDCIVIDHKDHKYEFVKKAAAESRNELEGKLTPLKEVQASLCKATEAVKATRKEVVDQRTTLTNTIEQSFAQLHEILEDRKRALLAEVTDSTDEKTGKLDVQEKELVTTSAVIQSLIDVVEQNMENTTDEELLTAQRQISNRIETETKNRQENPITFDRTSVEINKCFNVTQKCDRLAGQIRCLLDSCSTVVVNQPTKFSIHVPTLQNEGEELSVELKSCVTKSTVRATCVPTQDGRYEVHFTPQSRGRHELSVRVYVNYVPVAGSPFPVFVKVLPTQLMNPVRTISGEELQCPWGVAFNSSGEVFVATDNAECVVYDNHGTKVRTLKSSTQDTLLCGIAIDGRDNVYVADHCNNCLYKFNEEGKQVGKVGCHGNKHCEFNAPRGVSVIGDQVYVCERGNDRIQVFTAELEFVKVIGGKGSGNGEFKFVCDIAQDDLGQAYVCDSVNNRIQVFDRDFNFLYSFSKKGNNEIQLKGPVGICLYDQFVYVVENISCVSVFLRSGQFVTSFGRYGSEAGEFNGPFGISCDSDGFVYICDFCNHRVQIL